MSAIELSNTFAGFRKLKRDLSKLAQIFNYLSIFFFAVYYVYLIVKNTQNTFYLIAYSILFSLILLTLFIEVSLSEKKLNSKKKRLKNLVKIPKYILKSLLVGIAIYESSIKTSINLSDVINLLVAIFIVVQILLDLVVWYVTYYVDYITKCIELDAEQSTLVMLAKKLSFKNQIEENTHEELSKKDKKMYEKINLETEKYKAEKNQNNQSKKGNLTKIIDAGKDKIQKLINKKD